ncbi:MAG TPA: T9SS type A sorting domain-containing protein [Candidatus Kapabacteria bacterium]|nr:T9SS type A sorting domain-containing protein [Candidatus Kapabacteria bacterium]
MKTLILSLILLIPLQSSGQTGWYSLPGKFPVYDQVDVFFMNADTGFVGCVNSGLYKTIDGGHNWVKIQNSGYYPRIRYFKNNKVMFQIPGKGGVTLRSIDSGSTWETLDLPPLGDIDFPTPAIGYAISSNLRESSADTVLYFYATSDSGKTWTQTYLRGSETLLAGKRIKFRDELHGMIIYSNWTTPYPEFAAQGHNLLYTSDGGKNWSFVNLSLDLPTKISFINGRWICGYGGSYSSDEGIHWNHPQVFGQPSKSLSALYFSTSETDTIYAANDGTFADIFRSVDGGESYYRQNVPVFDHGNTFDNKGICDKIATPLSNIGYLVGHSNDTLIYKTIDAGGPPLSVRVQSEQSLYVYPNPTTDYIIIETQDFPTPVLLEVYDALGRKALSLEIPASTTSYRLDISQLASGMYTVKIADKITRFIKE